MSYRKTAHVLCAALRVYDRIASSALRQAFTATATATATAGQGLALGVGATQVATAVFRFRGVIDCSL